ncbi:MAG TPA: T9SS type A sorting domain-containing protein [Paludibacteraceae bacterium]|nr:T9SS type A sorting domain-containing protein [Paludibacteraceae bacterium]
MKTKTFTKLLTLLAGFIMLANANLAMGQEVNMNRWIELTVRKGQRISLVFYADSANTKVKVVSGTTLDTTFVVGTSSSGWKYLYPGDTTLKVYGNVKIFGCSDNNNNITGLDASNNTGLTSIECMKNNISSLNVSGLTVLERLLCYKNNLSTLDVSGLSSLSYLSCNNNKLASLNITGCKKLSLLTCHNNSFSTQALDDIYCSLPMRSVGNEGNINPLDTITDANYTTVIATNKSNAISKNWKVLYDRDRTNIPTTGSYACPELENYPLWVSGVQVTSANASAITGEGITGSVSYNDATKTLTLNNATITGYHAVGPTHNQSLYNIYSNDNITINVIGTNNLKIDKYSYDDQLWGCGIYAYNFGYKDVNLMGYGTLNIETNVYSEFYFGNSCIVGESISIGGLITLNINSSDYGIYSNKAISISGGASLEITTNATIGGRAIQVPKGKLTIDNISDRIIMQGNDAEAAISSPSLTMQDDGTISWSKPYVKIGRLPVNMNRWIELDVKQGGQVGLNLKADAESTRIIVISGNYDATFLAGTAWMEEFYVCYAGGTTMRVYGNIKEFACKSYTYNLGITGLDVSNNNGLEILGCAANSISSIKISGCESLEEIYCYSNNLSACGLDSIFHQLPIRPVDNKGRIDIKSGTYTNPGTSTCCDTIATNRNWEVKDYNEGNGSIPIVNKTYACPYFTIGIENIMVNNVEAKIYPNPASNNLNIECEERISNLELYDALGKMLISKENVLDNTFIDVSNFNSGIYILKIRTDKGSGEYKVIIE